MDLRTIWCAALDPASTPRDALSRAGSRRKGRWPLDVPTGPRFRHHHRHDGPLRVGPLALPTDEIGVMEAVITLDSELVGSSVGQLKLFDRHAINLLAVSARGHRPPLRSVKLRAGDVVVLSSRPSVINATRW